MPITYNRTADIEFALAGGDLRLTVNDLPFSMKGKSLAEAEQEAVFDAIRYLRELGITGGLSVVSVCSSPAGVKLSRSA